MDFPIIINWVSPLSLLGASGVFTTCMPRINPFKPGVPFMGHRHNRIAADVTPQNAASHLGLFCLLREFSSKN